MANRIKWTKELMMKEAIKYESRYAFQKGSNLAYQYAKRAKLLDYACSHMKSLLKSWTYETVKEVALKYKSRYDFQLREGGAYQYAFRKNILDDVCSHMEHKYISWDDNSVKKEALKYKTRNSFKKNCESAYDYAHFKNIIDEVCSHMEKIQHYWTLKSLKKEAFKYKTRTEFSKHNCGAYKYAQKKGMLDNVCSHMERGIFGFNKDKTGYLYYLSINGGMAYKIGITNRSVQERYTSIDLEKINIINVVEYPDGADAYSEERRILKEFSYAKYKGVNLLESGNTELFDRDVLLLDKKYVS